ncbi:hypothetical protein LTR62_004298 [Meristemomyces frigidus]|uniref:chitin synthase n=1 Tax=Meristemomyces frigidus TaxID=1508187 RepID=A0AAN7YG67_9PEZI|nr:hypothetical protein LTR62_004298 [Meristemomyces frigidus]
MHHTSLRHLVERTTASIAPWPVRDIVYVGIVGGVMLAAVLEWILWLFAFLYCFCKVFQKADKGMRWSTRILAVLNIIFFVAMRCIFLPVMLVTLPLPPQITRYFPEDVVATLQLFAFWAFAGLLTVPWLFCVYQLVTHDVGRTRRVKTVLDEYTAPKVVIIMPCYNEQPDVLLRTVDSIVDCDYPPSCMHVFLSFDGDKEGDLYTGTIEKLGVSLTLETYPKSIDIQYRDCRVTVSRFPHSGKRGCQKKTFKLIDRVYAEYLRRNDNLFLLFIDSDCILDRVCIQNFMYEMELRPKSRNKQQKPMLAMTGVITSTTPKNTLITLLQDMEYIHGQLFERSVESGCGAVTCLPGALTMLRFSAFRKMAKYYFADKAEQCNDLFDYWKCHLGEDRWLTHLFMVGANHRYQIQMNTGAFCKTEAVQTFRDLLKQRRRWFLGFITNEVCMLTDIRLWRRYPLLLIIRTAQNTIRTTALLFFIMVIAILTTEQKVANLPYGFIAVSLGLNWLLMIFFGLKLGRYKVMMYPLMFVLNPFMNWLYMVYGIFTSAQRTWGGPRADAGVADETTTPAQVIEQAKRDGDDGLNIVPESFRPALRAAARELDLPSQAPLLPALDIYGRFSPAEELPGGWYRHGNDSARLYHERAPWAREENVPYGRDSLDALQSTSSFQAPRRVESLFAEQKDARAYGELRPLQGHMETNGAFDPGSAFPSAAGSRRASFDSLESVPMHFEIPVRGRSLHLPAAQATSSPSSDMLPMLPPPAAVALPTPPLSRPRPRRHSTSPNIGPSPLARKSFTRLASPPVPDPASAPPLPYQPLSSHPIIRPVDADAHPIAPMDPVEVLALERESARRASEEVERRMSAGFEKRGRRGRRSRESSAGSAGGSGGSGLWRKGRR